MTKRNHDLIDIAVDLKAETDKAWLVFDGTKQGWVPKSQAELYKEGNRITLTLPAWLAEEKGFL